MILAEQRQAALNLVRVIYEKVKNDPTASRLFLNSVGIFSILLILSFFASYWSGSELKKERQNLQNKNKILVPLAGVPTTQDNPSTISSTDRTAQAVIDKLPPFYGLYKQTDYGKVPVIGSNGKTPFDAYSHPIDTKKIKKSRALSVIVKDLGISKKTTGEALNILPKEVTLSFSPYANKLNAQVVQAWDNGHEILLDLPLETKDFPKVDPGPLAMYTWADAKQNIVSLTKILGAASGNIGLLAAQDTSYFNIYGELKPLMGQIYGRGLAYIEPKGELSTAGKLALKNNSPYASIDMIIPASSSRDLALKKLKSLERSIPKKGHAVVTLSAKKASIDALVQWIETLKDQNITLVPISAIAGQ